MLKKKKNVEMKCFMEQMGCLLLMTWFSGRVLVKYAYLFIFNRFFLHPKLLGYFAQFAVSTSCRKRNSSMRREDKRKC